jgi:uncharacterized membrane protein (UPF0127 family)
MQITAYYGSKYSIKEWDISRTIEFGYHFGLDVDQSISRLHGHGHLYQVEISYNKPIRMRDALRWTLESILDQLGQADRYQDLKRQAIKLARANYSSLRVEENMIAARVLIEADYDAIIYDNMGESGGEAIIIWDPAQISILKSKQIGITETTLREMIREILIESASAKTLQVGGFPITVEVSTTPGEQQQGLMGRASLDPDSGMLFVYDKPQILSFWMKNTSVPLSIAFIGPDERVSEIRDLQPNDESHMQSSSPCRWALEANLGWFKARGIGVGAKISNLL